MSDLIKRDDALHIVDVAEDEHPYKIPGLFVTYSEYNQGWSDAVDFIRSRMEKADFVPAAPRWVRCEEPPQSGQECFTAYRSILISDPEWWYDICYYTDDLARDCPLMDGAEHRPGWYRYESEYGDVECHPKYWMPIEPPKEDA